ncbi:hypothetical protein BD779DRAFT_589267 [Infundibulicybe gibba]|nr:hypothetical protein BD779DRAFT_589267 [Infundibulicybe gibba]
MPTITHYQTLGISGHATPGEIKRGYREMALRWHPDRHPENKEAATKRFIEIQSAYKALRHDYQNMETQRRSKPKPAPVVPGTYRQSNQSTTSIGSDVNTLLLDHPSSDSHTTPSPGLKPGDSWRYLRFNPRPHSAPRRDGAALPTVPPRQNFSYHKGQSSFRPPDPLRPKENPEPYTKPARPHTTRGPESADKLRQRASSKSYKIPRDTHRNTSQHKGHSRYTTPTRPTHRAPRTVDPSLSKEWTHSLPLSLEELYHGKHCRFRIPRRFCSGQIKMVILDVDIPPGCQRGTKILCRGVGHEQRNGTLQDIAFIIQETPHHAFSRKFDDLIMDVRLPWVDSLKRRPGNVAFTGIDGGPLWFDINYLQEHQLKGIHVVHGAGMPIRDGGHVIGRGDLIVRWEIIPPNTGFLGFAKQVFSHFRR